MEFGYLAFSVTCYPLTIKLLIVYYIKKRPINRRWAGYVLMMLSKAFHRVSLQGRWVERHLKVRQPAYAVVSLPGQAALRDYSRLAI